MRKGQCCRESSAYVYAYICIHIVYIDMCMYVAVPILFQQQQLFINQLVIKLFYNCYYQLVLGNIIKIESAIYIYTYTWREIYLFNDLSIFVV